MNRVAWSITCLLAFSVCVACGDDDDDDNAGKDAGGSGKGDVGQVDGGGTGGRGSVGGTGGSAATSVACGDKTCTSTLPGIINACCVDEEAGTCGTAFAGASCMEMPVSDTRCPGIGFGGLMLAASCCTDDNQCGIAGMAGGGCTSLRDLSAGGGMGMGLGGFLPAPKTCDGSPEPEPDAGSEPEDAGK